MYRSLEPSCKDRISPTFTAYGARDIWRGFAAWRIQQSPSILTSSSSHLNRINRSSPYATKMSHATLTRLTNLRGLLASKPHREVLNVYLHHNEDNLLKEAVLVTLYRNWSTHPPYGLTEIGIAVYSRQQVNGGLPCHPGAHAESLLAHLWSIHLRVRSHAHLPSAGADPEAFHFGSSIFVTNEEATDMLHQIWHQPLNDAMGIDKGHRPIICLSFGDNDALGKVRNTDFDFIPGNMDTTVAVLNAQDIAIQAKITSSRTASMEYILSIFRIKPFHIGNAGNAATYITVIAFLSVLRDDLYYSESNPKARPGRTGLSASKSAQSVIQWLMERPTPPPPFGVTLYCTRCSSFEHEFAECPNTDFVCTKCLGSTVKWREENSATHKEGLCVFR
jgi:hypothetical protein